MMIDLEDKTNEKIFAMAVYSVAHKLLVDFIEAFSREDLEEDEDYRRLVGQASKAVEVLEEAARKDDED